MPNEQTKAQTRRQLDPRFAERWFVGDGLDIGCGNDPIDIDVWPLVSSVTPYDREIHPDHNAETLVGLDDEEFDFVHSSHCLEHMTNAEAALDAWIQVLKPGGFLICTVPDYLMYESLCWPSRHNNDHKNCFTMDMEIARKADINNVPIYRMPDLLVGRRECELEHVTLLTTHYNPLLFGKDQTIGPAECAIEFVLRKHLEEGQLEKRVVAD